MQPAVKQVGIMTANITSWTPKALQYFGAEVAGIAFVQDHKQRGVALMIMRKQLPMAGLAGVAVEAASIEAGATSGGTAILARSHL